jgi:cullin-4
VRRERCGEAINRGLLRDVVRALGALGVYTAALERPFVDDSAVFYAAESAAQLSALDVPGYLRHAETRLLEETDRAAACLEGPTRKVLLTCCEAQLVGRHIATLLDKGLAPLMDACTERSADLGRLYSLFARVGALETLRGHLGTYVRAAGTRLVRDEAQDDTLVSRLLEFKAALDGAHKQAFCGNEAFGHAIKDAFEVRRLHGTACV